MIFGRNYVNIEIMKSINSHFESGRRMGLPANIKPEELRAAKKAAEKALEEARKKSEAERHQREREEQAKIRLREVLQEQAPVHVITEKDIKEAKEVERFFKKEQKKEK